MTPTIRPAQPSDVPHIHRLLRALAEYEHMLAYFTITEASLHDVLFAPQPRAHVVVADIGADPVGVALFYYTFNSFQARSNIFLEDLFVDPACRGAGIGLGLMRHLAQRVIAEQCGRLEWRVLNWNKPSIDFYDRIGSEMIKDWQTRQLGGKALAALAEGTSHG